MAKKIIQFVTMFLCVVISLVSVVSATDTSETVMLRIGLNYNTDTLAGANLSNDVGTGYRFGYFNVDKVFYQVGYTGSTDISVVKTQNVYYGYVESYGRNSYSDKISSEIAVGCYHVQLPGSYAVFEEAHSAATVYSGGFAAWVDGTYYARVGNYVSSEAANTALTAFGVEGATVVGTSSGGVSVVATGTSTIIFQFDGGSDFSLAVRPGLDDSVVTKTLFKGYTYYGSFQYQRIDGGDMTVVNFVPIDDYVKGVLPYEMSSSWPLEALKAQAVCARTYALINLNKHAQYGFDLCTTVDCQVYRGTNSATELTDQAVEETAGQYAWYGEELAGTFYYSSNGGASEDVKNVWGSSYPYLVGVVDIYEPSVADKTGKYNWTTTFTKTELKEILHSKGYLCGDIVNFYVAETTATGNVYKITFEDVNGKTWSFVNTQQEYCRTLLGLNSIRYTISGGDVSAFINDNQTAIADLNGSYAINGAGESVALSGAPYVMTASGTTQMEQAEPGETFTITGSGWGHNVGMSQWGAYAMAEQGKTYDEILKFYFTGIDVK